MGCYERGAQYCDIGQLGDNAGGAGRYGDAWCVWCVVSRCRALNVSSSTSCESGWLAPCALPRKTRRASISGPVALTILLRLTCAIACHLSLAMFAGWFVRVSNRDGIVWLSLAIGPTASESLARLRAISKSWRYLCSDTTSSHRCLRRPYELSTG